jgi:hypothetical protein
MDCRLKTVFYFSIVTFLKFTITNCMILKQTEAERTLTKLTSFLLLYFISLKQ